MKKKLSLIMMLVGVLAISFSMHYGYGNIFKSIGKGLSKAGKAIGGVAKKGISAVKKGVTKAVDEVGKVAKKAVGEVGKGFKKVGDTIVKCARAASLSAEVSSREAAYQTAQGALEIAKGTVQAAQGSLDVATGTLEAANQTQKGLMIVADQAQKGVLRASNEVQKVGMDVAKGTLAVAAKLAELSAEAIAKGFNIKKVTFESSFASLAGGTLPEVTVEGVVFGKSFNLRLKADFTDIAKLAEEIINKVFA